MAKITELSRSRTRKANKSWGPTLAFFPLAVVAIAVLVVQFDTYETVTYPMHEFGEPMFVAVQKNVGTVSGLEKIGSGQLVGPEDLFYEPKSRVVYTGCHDGWIKRVKLADSVADSVVENWVHTGGRPLGIAIGESGDVFVADAHKGLLKVSIDGKLELLTHKADGVKFGMPDGVVVARNGIVYFTDPTYKYNMNDAMHDFMEGRPHGRLLSYDTSTKQTEVLVRDLYFVNGIELSPNQDFVIFCETFMRRCSRYYLQGEKKGSTDVFANNLPGLPDNIRYDGDGHYWLALPQDNSLLWRYTQTYPFLRKVFAFTLKRLHKLPTMIKFGGIIVLDLEGKPVGEYYDNTWKMTTSGVKIGEHLYMGSLTRSYILRLNLTQNPLIDATS